MPPAFLDPVANHHPWLKPGSSIPFRYGDYSAIKRRYLPTIIWRCRRTPGLRDVYVETEWDPETPSTKPATRMSLSERFGLPNAIVAQAWLDRDHVASVIAGQAAFPLVRAFDTAGWTRDADTGRNEPYVG